MKTDYKTIVLILAVTAAALAVGYYAGIQRGSPVAQHTGTGDTVPSAVPAQADMPAHSMPGELFPDPGTAHPGSSPATPPALPPQTGQAHLQQAVDPDAKFTHFRVGQRNVKRIMTDGDLMWVGTSGGVIRYNLETDDYRLFDIRSGLLANGIFYIGKLHDRIAVGTYGGGLALYDEPKDTWDIYNIPQGLGDAFVYDALEMPNGDIWIATWSGANRIRGGTLDDRDKWDLYTVDNTGGGLPNDWVYGLSLIHI